MITSGQRAKLRSMAQTVNPTLHIGKNGVTDNVVSEVLTALELHELIKISVLKNAETPAKAMLEELCERTDAEPVTAIGNKIVLFKRSGRDDINHIEI